MTHHRTLPVVFLSLVLFSPRPAQSGAIMLLSGSGVFWEARWPNSLPNDLLVDVGQVYRDGKPTKETGELRKTVTFTKDMDKLVIEFVQTTAALKNAGGKKDETGTGPSGGLFFIITQNITNGSEATWQSFTEMLEDKKPFSQDEFGTDVHPAIPHFHTALLDPKLVKPFKLKGKMSSAGMGTIEFGDGMVKPTETFTIARNNPVVGNLRIHEIEIKGEDNKRAFNLVEIPSAKPLPMPEAGTLVIVGVGMLEAIWWRRRVRRNRP